MRWSPFCRCWPVSAAPPSGAGEAGVSISELNVAHAELCQLFLTHVQGHAIALLDPQGEVRYVNDTAGRLFDHPAGQIVGRSAAVLYGDEDQASGRPGADLAAAAAEGHLRYEGWRQRADGSRFWADVTITALVDRDGELCGFGHLMRDITDSRRFQKELMRRALHDSLTGLPNRALLLDRLGKAIRRLERHPGHVAVYFVDLDRFKAINDRFGHRIGDLVLIAVAQRLHTAVRAQDTVARLSGDEFVVICEAVDAPAAALEIANRLVGALEQAVEVDGAPIPLHASIGAVILDGPGPDPEVALEHADTAMYRAKRRGPDGDRIRVEIWQPPATPLHQPHGDPDMRQDR